MKINEIKKLENLLFFTKESLRLLEKNENTLASNIKYWVKKGVIIPIKKGRYLLKSRLEKEEDKEGYFEYLANKIYQPSYLSCEYVMSKYGLLTEAVYGLTSVTTKKTKVFDNQLGKFTYYSLTPRLFFGFEIRKLATADILISKKPKAVFDFLYLRFLKKTVISEKAITELRINWENLSEKEFAEIKKYGKLCKNNKINTVINLIGKKYYD